MQKATIFTEAELKVVAFAPKAPALLSLTSSILVIRFFIRHPEKRKKMYHRIVFMMSLYGILLSLSFFIGTAAFPTDVPNSYGALGTVATCTAQGMAIQLSSTAVPLYYLSLSIYSYLAIKADFKQENFIWIEPWIHGTISIYTLTSIIVLAITENLNPTGSMCWIETFPLNCGANREVACQRGNPKQIALFIWIFSGVPVWGGFIVSTCMMVRIYRAQVRKEDINTLQRRRQVFENARRQKSRIIAIQASLYLMAFVTAFIMPAITRTSMYFGLPTCNLMRILGSCLLSLQSFFFTLVYLGLQISGSKNRQSTNEQSYFSVLKRRIDESTRCAQKPKEVSPTQPIRRRSFSIFDGSKISSSPWKMFLYDEDDDDDSEDISDDDVELQTCTNHIANENHKSKHETSPTFKEEPVECVESHSLNTQPNIESATNDRGRV